MIAYVTEYHFIIELAKNAMDKYELEYIEFKRSADVEKVTARNIFIKTTYCNMKVDH